MKNVQIVLDLNEKNMAELMKKNDLKNFDELRGYLLAIFHSYGVSEESAVYDTVDVVKKPMFNFSFDTSKFEKACLENRIATLEMHNALAQNANDGLKKRNIELIREIEVLRNSLQATLASEKALLDSLK